MALLYKEMIFPVRTSDFDANDHIKPSAVLDYFQQMACLHASELKLEYNDLIVKNLIWMIISNNFEILKNPQTNESIIVATWPKPKGRLYYERDYEIRSLNGDVLVKGSSKWVIVDFITRKIVRGSDVDYEGEYYRPGDLAIADDRIKINDDLVAVYKHLVTNSNLDHNKHMNNIKYADVMIDAVDIANVKKFTINYVFEAKKNDIIEVYHQKENNLHYFKGLNGEKECFTAKIETEE